MERRITHILRLCLLLAGCVLALPALAEEPLVPGPAGETICAPRAKLLARLEHGRAFTAQGQGLRDAEAMMEVRADPDGNWLLLQSYADGLSCLIAMGEAWEPALAPAIAQGLILPPAREETAG